jgi:predicted ATP-dependent serine protease
MRKRFPRQIEACGKMQDSYSCMKFLAMHNQYMNHCTRCVTVESFQKETQESCIFNLMKRSNTSQFHADFIHVKKTSYTSKHIPRILTWHQSSYHFESPGASFVTNDKT